MFRRPGARGLRHGACAPVLRKMPCCAAASLAALLLLLSVVQLAGAACANVTLLSLRLDTLLAEYDRESVPSAHLKVYLTLDVRHATISERHSSVRMLADLKMSWEDARLAWNSTEWGCNSVLAPAERLWLPDVMLVSAATQGSQSDPQRARLTSAGHVAWTTRLDLSAPVALQLEAWPRDLHTITFKFASRDHDTDQLDIIATNDKLLSVFESGAWELASVTRSEETWSRGGSDRRVAKWTLGLRRRAPAHALATNTVLAAVVLLMLAAMFLPPVDRPPLFACASFTAALWLVCALVRLPGSASAPRAVQLVGALCACGGVAALCAALVRRVGSARRPPPARLRSALAAAAALCTLTPEHASGESGVWAAAAQLLDYVLMAALLLTVFIIICFAL